MPGESSPNEKLTPAYIDEELVFVPLLVFYLGNEAIRLYVENVGKDV